MKKCLMICIVIFLFGCQPSEKRTIMVPQGSPAMTVLGLNEHQYQLDIVNGPEPLIAAFGSASHDAIIAPTNLGVKLFQSKNQYRLAAVLVWGNYHLVSTSFSSSQLSEVSGKDILVFGHNQTSDIIIKHLLDDYEIDANITYVDSVSNASAIYLSDPTKIVMVAEPSLSKLKMLIPETKSIDLQSLYKPLHDQTSYPQASLFVKSDLNASEVNQWLHDIEQSINLVNEMDRNSLLRGIELGIVDNLEQLESSISGSHLMFLKPKDAKNAITVYLNIILEVNAHLIGGKLPDESFYWSDDM